MPQITIIAGKNGAFDFSDRPLPKVSKRFVTVEVSDEVLRNWIKSRETADMLQREMRAEFLLAQPDAEEKTAKARLGE